MSERKRVVYWVECDVAGCPAETGPRKTAEAAGRTAARRGWEHWDWPGAGTRLHRCPACAAADCRPEPWRED